MLPIVRSGEADPEVARFLNRWLSFHWINENPQCLLCPFDAFPTVFPQIERLPVYCGQICSHEGGPRWKDLQKDLSDHIYMNLKLFVIMAHCKSIHMWKQFVYFSSLEILALLKKLWQQPEQESFIQSGPSHAAKLFLLPCQLYLHFSSALIPAVTGWCTSLDSCGTECSPMSWGTDCGPRREDTSDRSGSRSVCSSGGRISRERRCQSCGGRGKSPSHWHLSKASGGIS